jgi:DNA-binding response OmpR family regulator
MPHPTPEPQLQLKGRRILIVEDEYLVAKALAQALQALGAEVIGPAPTLDRGLELLQSEGNRVDAALLDVNLGGVQVYPLADRLIARGTPIVFITGYDGRAIPPLYANVTRFEKPVRMRRLVEALSKLAHQNAQH